MATGSHQQLFHHWRELLAERVEEAIAELGLVAGVRGLVVGGSTGRGAPWPLSDIDILPIVAIDADAGAKLEQRRSFLVDWWAASARAQTLDVGWLRFTDQEAEQAISWSPADAARKMLDRRWFHGLDKAYGGRGAADPDGLADAFVTWVNKVRFDPVVVSARVAQWWAQVDSARNRALDAVRADDSIVATLALREAARALRLVLVEGWGERLGSMGREWTRFEQMAREHDAEELAMRIADLVEARSEDALQRGEKAPVWLQARIALAFAARQEIGEHVTIAENARDQLAAFAVHVPRYRPQPWGEWICVPDPKLDSKLVELDELIHDIHA
jgi:hypothetical protein